MNCINHGKILRITITIAIACLYLPAIISQENDVVINTSEEERYSWNSYWISHPEGSVYDYRVLIFRNSFELREVPEKQIVYVSADNRYRLFINGKQVCAGPARGSLQYWRYEKVDIAPFLVKGKNLIASEVYNYGEYKPAAQFSHQTAFIFQAEGDLGNILNTGNNTKWLVSENNAYKAIPVSREIVRKYYVAGPCDSIYGKRYPWNWEKQTFDDSDWLLPRILSKGVGRGYMHGTPWMLVPRNIPPMEEKREVINLLVRKDGNEVSEALIPTSGTLVIPPRVKTTLLLDNKKLTVGYPVLVTLNGAGSSIRVTYSEALYLPDGSKGNRNEIKNKKIEGYYDVFLPAGGNSIFRPLWLRTFRFIQLEVETSDEPLIFQEYYNIFTAYPFEQNASFESDNALLSQIWETGWHTARLCAGETYMDCPYWEQLQYLGDTRIQALISLYNSGDDRLMRNAILSADQSRLPEGLTLSRGPSYIPQIIPTFSLFWIDMVHDYFMHRKDDEFIKQFLPGIKDVLNWFEQRMNDNNLIGPMEWFNFSDWTDGFAFGAAAGADTGNSALNSLKLVYALQRASELFDYFGHTEESQFYFRRANEIKQAVFINCWDGERKLLRDIPDSSVFSQHTNIFGILTGTVPAVTLKETMKHVLDDKDLIQCTIYFRFYLVRALYEAGMADYYFSQLDPWEDMIKKGLTTFEEGDYDERSDCHAWGASPNYDLLATVCGITPAEPGFKTVNIAPSFGSLKHIKAAMPHPAGKISLEFSLEESGELKGYIQLPEGINGTFFWNGKKTSLTGGRNEIY